jgi:hypothetical protein
MKSRLRIHTSHRAWEERMGGRISKSHRAFSSIYDALVLLKSVHFMAEVSIYEA